MPTPPASQPHPDVDVWLTVPDAADRLGLTVTALRRYLDDRDLIAVRRGERNVLSIPEGFLTDEGPLPSLRGTVTVLADGGLDDGEIIDWLHARDETLPGADTALGAMRAGFVTEVRRRAMEEAL